MFKKKNESTKDPTSKSGLKGPTSYQGYIIAVIIILIVLFYSFMYW